MGWRRSVWVFLLLLLFLGVIVNCQPIEIKQAHAPVGVDPENLFMRQFTEFRRNLHLFFNGTAGGYSQYQNFTADTGGPGFAVGQRWMLTQLALLSTYAYEKTGEEKYLAEAKFLVDLFEDGSRQLDSGAIESYSRGFSYVDANQYWAMQKLNEYGWGNYDIKAKIDNVMSYVGVDNSTDLMWSYFWDTSAQEIWTVNTWRPFLALLGYLTYKEVADYTDEIGRIFSSIERGRADNDLYVYTLGGSASPHYTLCTLWGILTGYMYVPEASWNRTAIQATLNAINNTKFWYEDIAELAGIDVLLQNIDDFDQNLQTKRGLIMYYHLNISTFFHLENAYGTEYDRARFLYLVSSALHSLGMTTSYSIPTLTNDLLISTNYAYSPYTLHYPQQGYYPKIAWKYSSGARFDHEAKWAVRWYQRYGTTLTDSWNGTHFNSQDSPNTGGGYIMWNISRFVHEVGMTLTQAYILELETRTSTTYDAFVYMVNGTVREITSEPEGTIYSGLRDFLIFRDRLDTISEISGMFVYSPNNSTWIIEQTPPYTRMKTTTDYVFVKGFWAEWDNSTKTKNVLFNALLNWTENGHRLDNWTVDNVLGLSLAEWQKWFYEIDRGKLILFSHNLTASISNVNWAPNILSFNLTASARKTSRTYVYVGEKGEPTSVSGASTWTYDSATKMLTLTVMHSSSQNVEICWGETPADIPDLNEDGIVDILDLYIVVVAFGTMPGMPKWDPRADLAEPTGLIDGRDLIVIIDHFGQT